MGEGVFSSIQLEKKVSENNFSVGNRLAGRCQRTEADPWTLRKWSRDKPMTAGSEPNSENLDSARIFAWSKFDKISWKLQPCSPVIVYMWHSMVSASLSLFPVCPPGRRPRDVVLYAHAHATLESSYPQIHGSSRFMNCSCLLPCFTQII